MRRDWFLIRKPAQILHIFKSWAHYYHSTHPQRPPIRCNRWRSLKQYDQVIMNIYGMSEKELWEKLIFLLVAALKVNWRKGTRITGLFVDCEWNETVILFLISIESWVFCRTREGMTRGKLALVFLDFSFALFFSAKNIKCFQD